MLQVIIKTVFLTIVLCLGYPVHLSADGIQANIYVMGGAPAGGDGSKKHPYNSLADVEAGSIAGDKITVLYSNIALDGGITLKDGQHLQGKKGKKENKNNLPVITNTSSSTNDGNGVIAANSTKISHLNIRDVQRNGVYFVNASKLIIQNNLIENPNRGTFSLPCALCLLSAGGSGIRGLADVGLALDILIEDNEINANGHSNRFTRGIDIGAGMGGEMTAVVLGNHVSNMNGRAYLPYVAGNGIANFLFEDNSAKTIGPANADSFFIFGGDSGQISVDVRNYFLDNSEIGIFGDPTNHGFEVWTGLIIPGSGFAAQVNVTADGLVIHDSAADGIFIGNNLPDAIVNVTISNSEILRAAGRLTGGIGVIAHNDTYGLGIPFVTASLSLKVETTDVIGTLPGINFIGLPVGAIEIVLAGVNDVYDFGGGALGSVGQNRLLENPLDYVSAINAVDIFAENNYYGGDAPSYFHFGFPGVDGDILIEPYLTEDPRP